MADSNCSTLMRLSSNLGRPSFDVALFLYVGCRGRDGAPVFSPLPGRAQTRVCPTENVRRKVATTLG